MFKQTYNKIYSGKYLVYGSAEQKNITMTHGKN